MIHIHKAVETFKKKKFSLDNSQGNNLQTEIRLYKDGGTRHKLQVHRKGQGASAHGLKCTGCKCTSVQTSVQFYC